MLCFLAGGREQCQVSFPPSHFAQCRFDNFIPVDRAGVRMMEDLLRALGDISLDRVWLDPLPGTAADGDVILALDKFNRVCELVNGTLVEKAGGILESRMAVLLSTVLH